MAKVTQSFTIHLEGEQLDIRLGEVVGIECWIQPDGLYQFTFIHQSSEDKIFVKPENFQTLNIM